MIDEDAWTNQYRLVSEMIDRKVLKPSTSPNSVSGNKEEENNIILLK